MNDMKAEDIKGVIWNEGIELRIEQAKLHRRMGNLMTESCPDGDLNQMPQDIWNNPKMQEIQESLTVTKWRLYEVGVMAELFGYCQYRENFQTALNKQYDELGLDIDALIKAEDQE